MSSPPPVSDASLTAYTSPSTPPPRGMATAAPVCPDSPPRQAIHSSLRTLIANANLSPSSPNYGKISSPMSSLALNLSGLSTVGEFADFGETPRRKLSLDLDAVDTPEGVTPNSLLDDGIFTDSPGSAPSPTVEMSLSKLAHEYNKDRPSSYGRSRSLPFRKLQNTPIPAFNLKDFDDSNSDNDTEDDDIASDKTAKFIGSFNLDSSGCGSDDSDNNPENNYPDNKTDTKPDNKLKMFVEAESMDCASPFSQQIVSDVITDTVSRSLDFNMSDDHLDCSLELEETSVRLDNDTSLELQETSVQFDHEHSLELQETSVRLDDSDSQGIVADFDDSLVFNHNESYVCSTKLLTKSHNNYTTNDDSFTLSTIIKPSLSTSLSDTSITSDLDGSFISPAFSAQSPHHDCFSSPVLSKPPRTDGSFISPHFSESSPQKSNSFFRSPHKSGDFNPTGILHDGSGSQDSGVGMEKDRDSQDCVFSQDREADDVFRFPVPISAAPRRMRVISEDACSPIKYSPIKTPSSHRCPPSFSFISPNLSALAKSPNESSPVSLKTSPLTGTANDDDGFLSEMDNEVRVITDCASLPDSFSSLFSAPLLNGVDASGDGQCKKTRVCRKLLDRSISVQEGRSLSHKRASPMTVDHMENNPTPCKRRRSSVVSDSAILHNGPIPRPKACLKRCSSESEAIIKSVLNKVTEDANLIGDGSKPYLLPVIKGRHADLKSISPHTLATVLTHNIDEIERCVIIDARYPYEYNGGHIGGSQNFYQKQDIIDNLLQQPLQSTTGGRVLLVFHCEFSAERAPTLSRFLRNKDRDTNKDNYPDLYYPETYLLEGGYKAFYEQHPELCEPRAYKPMLHEDHREDLRKFRIKSRSWTDDKTRTSLRLKF